METSLSSWSQNTVPPNYVMPEDKRPGGDITAPVCKDIPIIDLSQLNGLDRVEIIQQIMKANMDLGIFQVINHGVSEEVMDETMDLFKEFFDMPTKDKATYYSSDPSEYFNLYRSSIKGVKTWKDSMRHICAPLGNNIQSWPEKPARYRDVVRAYSVEVRKLALRILDLICEGLGLEFGYFGDELSQLQELLVHNYPPCPEPSLVLGLGGHNDPSLLTLLQQYDISGLQIFKGGQWLGIISNGKLKSARHRAVTNANFARTSLVTFISPSLESFIKPEKIFLSASEPQLFKCFRFKDYRDFYFSNLQDPTDAATVDAFKLSAN